MRLDTVVFFLGACIGLAGLMGCSTVERRIDERSGAFRTWPLEVQQDVRAGVLRLGYTTEMAYVAFGRPDARIRSEDDGGVTLIWVYRVHVPVGYYEPAPFHGWAGFGYGHGGYPYHHYHGYDPWYAYQTRDYRRLHFVDDRIVKIEELD